MITKDDCGEKEIVLDLWGDFALFTRTETKVERDTYEIPTPSAVRGILEAIYDKPVEFYYMVTKIEVMHPIRTITMKRNEVKRKADAKHVEQTILVEEERTQRHSVLLKDVYYRVHAKMIPQPGYLKKNPEAESKIYAQFEKRLKKGKCFYQPYFGSKEYMCFFDEPNQELTPIHESRDFGWMLYDIFNIKENQALITSSSKKKMQKGSFCPSYFHAVMNDGRVEIPAYDSDEILKEGD